MPERTPTEPSGSTSSASSPGGKAGRSRASAAGSTPSSPPPKADRVPGVPDDVEGTARYDRPSRQLLVRRLLWRGKRQVEVVTFYDVRQLNPDPSVGPVAVRLIQADGTSYDLIRREFGWTCECKDFLTRRVNSGKPCKHIAAVLKAGMLTDRGDAWEGG